MENNNYILWDAIDKNWNNDSWEGWSILGKGNKQLRKKLGAHSTDPDRIRRFWETIRNSFRQEREFLLRHPDYRWTTVPVAYLGEVPPQGPDFVYCELTVDLKKAANEYRLNNYLLQLDKDYYGSGPQNKYSSHGADMVIFTDLDPDASPEDPWTEWYCIKDDENNWVIWETCHYNTKETN